MEDGYLDSYWEDQYDNPWYADYESEPDEYEDYDDGDDFPLYLEYPDEDLQDLEPPF